MFIVNYSNITLIKVELMYLLNMVKSESSVSIIDLLEERGVETGAEGVQISVKEESGGILPTLVTFLPIILFGALILFMLRRGQGGINQVLGIGKSRARQFTQDRPTVTFADVAGGSGAHLGNPGIMALVRN